MVNPFKEVSWNPDLAERRKFGKSFVIGWPCIALLLLAIFRLKFGEWHTILAMHVAGWGAGFGVICWLVPGIATPLYRVWYFFACCIGFVLGNVLLGILFYVLFGCVGLFMRLIGRDALQRRFDHDADSYWRNVNQPENPKRYYCQY